MLLVKVSILALYVSVGQPTCDNGSIEYSVRPCGDEEDLEFADSLLVFAETNWTAALLE